MSKNQRRGGMFVGRGLLLGLLLALFATAASGLSLNPRFVADVGGNGASSNIAVGRYMYSFDFMGTLSVYDMQNPAAPVQLGMLQIDLRVLSLHMSTASESGFVFTLRSDADEVMVFDFRDKSSPSVFAERVPVPLSGVGFYMRAYQDLVYLEAFPSSLWVLRFKHDDPVPSFEQQAQLSVQPVFTVLDGYVLNVATRNGIDSYDFGGRTSGFVNVGFIPNINLGFLTVAGVLDKHVAALTPDYRTLLILDTRVAVGVVGSVQIPVFRSPAIDPYVSADPTTRTIYILNNEGLVVVDARDLTNPVVVSAIPTRGPGLSHLAVGAGYAVVIEFFRSAVMTPFGPADPYYHEVLAGEKHVYAASDAGVVVFGADDPAAGSVGKYDVPRGASGFALRGTVLYVAEAAVEGGVLVLDVSDPTSPQGMRYLSARSRGPPTIAAVNDDALITTRARLPWIERLATDSGNVVDFYNHRDELHNDFALSDGVVYFRSGLSVLSFDPDNLSGGSTGEVVVNFGARVAASGGLVFSDSFPDAVVLIDWARKAVEHSVAMGGRVHSLAAGEDAGRTVVYVAGNRWMKAYEVCPGEKVLRGLREYGMTSFRPSVAVGDGAVFVADGAAGVLRYTHPSSLCGVVPRPPPPAPVPPRAGRPFSPGGCAVVRPSTGGMYPCYPISTSGTSTDDTLFLHGIPSPVSTSQGPVAWFPPSPVPKGTEIVVRCGCTGAGGCGVVVVVYHCPPCSQKINGGLASLLPGVSGFNVVSCAPRFTSKDGSVPGWEGERHRMAAFYKNLSPGETLKLPATTVDASHVALFTTAAPLPADWCPPSKGSGVWQGPIHSHCSSRFC